MIEYLHPHEMLKGGGGERGRGVCVCCPGRLNLVNRLGTTFVSITVSL